MFQNPCDAGLPRRVVGVLATAQAPKENPSLCSLLNNLPTRNILCDLIALRVQYYLLPAHEQTTLVSDLNKIHQT